MLTPCGLGARAARVDWQQWYRKITVQNLLYHRAIFTRSGDEDCASAMFLASPNHPLTYHIVHRHFLRTRKLLYEPDTARAYSNHEFCLWTLLIERMSGKCTARTCRTIISSRLD